MNYHEWYRQKEEYEDRAYKLMYAMHGRPTWIWDSLYEYDENGITISWLDRDGDTWAREMFNFVVLDSGFFEIALEEARLQKQKREEIEKQRAEERQRQQKEQDKESRYRLFLQLQQEFA